MKTGSDPSLIQSSVYRLGLLDYRPDKTVTIIKNNYLKNIRENLLDKESTNIENSTVMK